MAKIKCTHGCGKIKKAAKRSAAFIKKNIL
jgi:hypothetical protein